MTMHEHDQEIIMALAEGSLDPEAAQSAGARIAECAECGRDLELQRIALDALGQAPRAYLTATESAHLHDRLHRELGVATPREAAPRASFAWARWTGFAFGAAAVFLAVFLVIPAILGGGSDDSADTAAIQEVSQDAADGRSATTAAAAVPSAEAPQVGTEDLSEEMGLSAAEATTTAVPETTAAPETTSATESTAAPADESYELEYVVQGEMTEDLRAEVIDQLTADVDYYRAGDAAARSANSEWEACLDSETVTDLLADGATSQIIGLLVDDDGTERIIAALVGADPAAATLAAITVPDCTIFSTLP